MVAMAPNEVSAGCAHFLLLSPKSHLNLDKRGNKPEVKSTSCEACEHNHLQTSLEEEFVARAKINGIKTGEELLSEAFTWRSQL